MEDRAISPKELLLQGIEQAPKEMLQELLDCFLKLKARYRQKTSSAQAAWPAASPTRSVLVAESQGFWSGKPLDKLRQSQKPVTVASLQEFAMDLWPEDESTDDFLSFLVEQRQASVES